MKEDLNAIPRYPLEWSAGWKRTPGMQRQRAEWRQLRREAGPAGAAPVKREVALSVLASTQRLERQLELLNGTHAVLSTNVSLRLDGRPRSDEEPKDPGAAVYFVFKGKATVLACDRWTRVADNINALALHIDALRRVDRYGVGTIEQALAGYKALPADTAADWRSVFGYPAGARPAIEDLQARYKVMARDRHPDRTHDDGAGMAWVNRARDYALQELEG